MSYTDPAAPTEGELDQVDEITGAVQFVNQHGGWNGMHRLTQAASFYPGSGNVVRFQQYYEKVPIVSDLGMNFGYIELIMQKGVVTSYERSLLNLNQSAIGRSGRVLPGGEVLRGIISLTEYPSEILALFPAFRPEIAEDDTVVLHPVWAVRLADGSVRVLAESYPEHGETAVPEIKESQETKLEASSDPELKEPAPDKA
jgi:regulatory protein YycH of two-component signal transduction system YycFG